MDLPDIQIICLEALERFLQHPYGDLFPSAVRAYLRHDDRLLPPALQRLAQPHFAGAVVIIPGIIEKVDARIQSGVNDRRRRLLRFRRAQMVAPDAESRNLYACPAERPLGNWG